MADNYLSHPTYLKLLEILGSHEACARWIRSTRSTVRSATFNALLENTGDFDSALAWLNQVAPKMPREVKQIERFHVRVRDPKTGKPRETTVSLDHELHRALIEKTGSGKEAAAWISAAVKSLDSSGGSLSRALQGEIVRFVSGQSRSGE